MQVSLHMHTYILTHEFVRKQQQILWGSVVPPPPTNATFWIHSYLQAHSCILLHNDVER